MLQKNHSLNLVIKIQIARIAQTHVCLCNFTQALSESPLGCHKIKEPLPHLKSMSPLWKFVQILDLSQLGLNTLD